MRSDPGSPRPESSGYTKPDGKVLVVDDEPYLGELMHRTLTLGGYESLVAASPADALSMARRYRVSLLVTDLTMPDMDGIALARALREIHDRVPVILVADSPEARDLPIEPPAAVLAKPFSLVDLLATAAALLALPPLAS